MPQIAPMLWIILFIYFTVLFVFFIASIYYITLPSAPQLRTGFRKTGVVLNWK